MKRIIIALLMCFGMVGTCFATNPFDFLLKPPKPPGSNQGPLTPPVDTTTSPFLKEFLAVYEGDWVFISNVGGTKYLVDIFKYPGTCNADNTECCGRLEARTFGDNSLVAKGLFCLSTTYGIHIRDEAREVDIQCIGVRGARMGKSIHKKLPGHAIDDPTLINCGTFWLVRPE